MKKRNEAPEQEGADRGDVVQRLQVVGVLEHPAGLAEQADEEEGEEGAVEEDEERPEVRLAEPLVQRLAGHLGEPEVKAGEEGEDQPAHDRVVEVGQDEEAPVHRDVDGDVGEEDAR